MKAIIHSRYGPPEVAELKEIPAPQPQKNELLIKVMATTVNRTDCGFRSAEYFVSRFFSGLFRPKQQTLGCEFAGVVEAVGSNVTLFSVGDKIVGYNDEHFGAHAQYLVVAEGEAITHLPHNLSFKEAAALTEGAHYALCNLRAAKVQAGQNVLVYGATGAIGSAAVQLLKHFGANVTAVCNTPNVSLVKSLGVDVVIDYTQQDYTTNHNTYDFVFDAVGKSSFGQAKKVLTKNGIYISTELGKNGENIYLALLTPLLGGKRLLFPLPTISKSDVELLRDLAEAGKFKPVIDRTYPLEQIVEAYRYVESGQKIGNVIVTPWS